MRRRCRGGAWPSAAVAVWFRAVLWAAMPLLFSRVYAKPSRRSSERRRCSDMIHYASAEPSHCLAGLRYAVPLLSPAQLSTAFPVLCLG